MVPVCSHTELKEIIFPGPGPHNACLHPGSTHHSYQDEKGKLGVFVSGSFGPGCSTNSVLCVQEKKVAESIFMQKRHILIMFSLLETLWISVFLF